MLENLTIIELAMYLPLPYAGSFFAHAGANVIKVENPLGDPMKNIDSNIYNVLNKQKKIKYLDLRNEKQREELKKLIKDADVVLNGFKPGFLENLGLDYNKIKEIAPQIIYISLAGYDKNLDIANKAGHDLNFISLSGIIGSLNEQPKPFNFQMADMTGALWAIIGTFFMLEKRRKFNRGDCLDLSLFRSLLSFFPFFYFSSPNGIIEKGGLSGEFACYNIYKCKDNKFFAIGCVEEKFFRRLLELLNIEYKNNTIYEEDKQKFYINKLQEKFLQQDRDYWISFFKNEDICVTPVIDKDEFFNFLKTSLWQDNLMDFLLFPIDFSRISNEA